MSLKEFKDKNGDPCFVDLAEVTGIFRADTIATISIVERRNHPSLRVVGFPQDVAKCLGTPEDTLPRAAVVEALTAEYRMALGWDGMPDDSAQRLHEARYVIRKLAERLGVVLDERLINTPLEEK